MVILTCLGHFYSCIYDCHYEWSIVLALVRLPLFFEEVGYFYPISINQVIFLVSCTVDIHDRLSHAEGTAYHGRLRVVVLEVSQNVSHYKIHFYYEVSLKLVQIL